LLTANSNCPNGNHARNEDKYEDECNKSTSKQSYPIASPILATSLLYCLNRLRPGFHALNEFQRLIGRTFADLLEIVGYLNRSRTAIITKNWFNCGVQQCAGKS